MENTIATVRVLPFDEENEEEDERAMEYEYPDYDILINHLRKDKDIVNWEYTGNAVSIESKNKEAIIRFKELVEKQNPKENIGIEWDYWVE